jgi:hypothetical protein
MQNEAFDTDTIESAKNRYTDRNCFSSESKYKRAGLMSQDTNREVEVNNELVKLLDPNASSPGYFVAEEDSDTNR